MINIIHTGNGMWQAYCTTLSSADYAKVRTVSFSDGGVVYLPAGHYRISPETLWTAQQAITMPSCPSKKARFITTCTSSTTA